MSSDFTTNSPDSVQGNASPVGMASVPDYLIWSIITTFCCCLPLGVIGIILSVLSKTDLKNGDYNNAVTKSKIAFWCNLVGVSVGLLSILTV